MCLRRFMYVNVYFTLFRYVCMYMRTSANTYVCISSLVSSIILLVFVLIQNCVLIQEFLLLHLSFLEY